MRYACFLLILLILCVFTPRDPHAACYWDSDTLRTEAMGLPEAVDTIVGRFDRFPDLYYQMRLDRAAKALESNPDLLNELDDAAMSAERLGNANDAVAWMEKKHAALERLRTTKGDQDPVYKDHQYRYLANLGTILAHRWLHDGASREKMDDLLRSRDLIAAAIALNPDAHFGREKYQLMAIEWLIQPKPPGAFGLSVFIDAEDGRWVLLPRAGDRDTYAEAEAGIRGLIVLGAAWESIDVFQTYGVVHGLRGDASLSYLAFLRSRELREAGKTSLAPSPPPDAHAATADELLTYIPARDQLKVEAFYARARADGEAWRGARNAYILERLNRGEHPDTSPQFWDAWTDPPRISTPDGLLGAGGTEGQVLRVLSFCGASAVVVIGIPIALLIWRRRVLRRRDATLPSAT